MLNTVKNCFLLGINKKSVEKCENNNNECYSWGQTVIPGEVGVGVGKDVDARRLA